MGIEELNKNNILIAEFMGKSYHTKYSILYIETTTTHSPIAKYDSSWEWLMPVIDRIEGLFDNAFIVDLSKGRCFIHTYIQIGKAANLKPILHVNEVKLVATYKAVIDFIKWYNENK